MSKQANNGRAFEWALASELSSETGCAIKETKYSISAFNSYKLIPTNKQAFFDLSAQKAVAHIIAKEAKNLDISLNSFITFNSDQAGKYGDVRDVLLITQQKEIGFSCKTNHEALKHPRLSSTIDFVKSWKLNLDGCSKTYWEKVNPIFERLNSIKMETSSTARWDSIPNKAETIYWPLLDAWAEELERVCQTPQSCHALIAYLIGHKDFYKIISSNKDKSVHIQGWNFNNNLVTKQTKYPTSIIAINNKNGGQYSKTVTLNHGYSINFRIHSASSRVEPSLKFDINAIGLPSTEVYQNTISLY